MLFFGLCDFFNFLCSSSVTMHASFPHRLAETSPKNLSIHIWVKFKHTLKRHSICGYVLMGLKVITDS